MHLWDRQLPYAFGTLNLLWQAIISHTISTNTYFNRLQDYNKMPLVPLGCAKQMHGALEYKELLQALHFVGQQWKIRENFRQIFSICKYLTTLILIKADATDGASHILHKHTH